MRIIIAYQITGQLIHHSHVSCTDPERCVSSIGINFMLRFSKIKPYALTYPFGLAVQFCVAAKFIMQLTSHCTGQKLFTFH
jgi:hypothetical protein